MLTALLSLQSTPQTPPLWKSVNRRVFALVVRQTPSPSLPTYTERVMAPVPVVHQSETSHGLHHRSLSASQPTLRFSRFISEVPLCLLQTISRRSDSRKEHQYYRRTCLDAAISLLDYQNANLRTTLPGGLLRQNGRFITSLAIHNVLLATRVIYLVVPNRVEYDESR